MSRSDGYSLTFRGILDILIQVLLDPRAVRERERDEMVQTVSGHSRCGVGARASRHPAKMMICTRAATVGEAVAMQWRPWQRSAVVVTAWRCFLSLGCAPTRDRV
jgi:hypothetical protein